MLEHIPHEPIDYLVIGHIAVDLSPAGNQLGGTVSYSALTAHALGLRVGMVTSVGDEISLKALAGIQIANVATKQSTTFENIKTESGRVQTLHHRAAYLQLEHIPQIWRSAPLIHFAPIANEVDENMMGSLSGSLVGVTPQGWMRKWDAKGRVEAKAWENSEQVLGQAGAVIMSAEDVNFNLEQVEAMAHQTRVFCLTEGESGSVLYWNGDRRRFRPPRVDEVDATGAGDIFAAAFFTRLYETRDPWEAARFATHLAAHSVTRTGLSGIPTKQEIDDSLMEVIS